MGLRAGYKQTEVGPVPVEWQVATLGDISVVRAGGTPSRENARYWNGAIPWVTTSQIDFDDISDAEQFITEAGLRSSAAKMLPPGTLLMALYGQGKTRGKVAFLAVPAATNQACASITLSSAVAPAFIKQFLAHRYEAIRSASNGGSQDNLNGQIVKNLPVILPPLPEQRAIAAALSDVDALIGSLDRLIAKKRDLKQAAMQQLLTGQTRLPGFALKSTYQQSEVGLIPDDWEARHIDQIGVVTSGKRLPLGSSLVDHPTPHPYVRVTDMRPGTVSLSDIKFVPEHVFPAIKRYRIFCDDIFISVAGTLGIVGKVPSELHGANLTENADRITSLTCSQDYLLHVLMSPLIQNTIDSIQTVGAQPKLALTRIRKFSVPVPPRAEQDAIATVLSDMDAELTALAQHRDKTRLLKQGMMQELLTGRTRLV